jgi:short-subunit dehydrogenase
MINKHYTLITGASEGFGKALALECASHSMDLILVSLPGSGLSHLANFIESNFEVSVIYFELDLSRKENCYKLFDEVEHQNLSLNILINNAGMGGTHSFEERNVEFYSRQIDLNVVAPTLITRLFLENLERNCPAHILNVSSLAGFFYMPEKQVYAGTKSFLISFSKSLRGELRSRNINVSVVCPGGMNTNAALTVSNFCEKGLSRWSIMNPEEVAKITIAKMLKKKEVIVPGFWNHCFLLFGLLLPKFIREKLTMGAMKKRKGYYTPIIPTINPLKKAV